MINGTLENFETEVVAASQQTPVLVDFWAPWCGPCKVIGPLLENLETAYAGRFKLVKIDSDAEPELSQAFGIRSIPTCVLMKDGRPLDGFMGALPEGQIKAFLDKHLPEAVLEAEVTAEHVDDAPPEDDPLHRAEVLQQAVLKDPQDVAARFAYGRHLLHMGDAEGLRAVLVPVRAQIANERRLQALQHAVDAIDSVAGTADLAGVVAQLDAKIAANRRDFAARFARAQALMAQRLWTAAMDELLEILMRDKSWNDELARKVFIAILDLIEPEPVKVEPGQVPPTDPTVSSYRRRLSSVVLS
jgi:putative thioredoxin